MGGLILHAPFLSIYRVVIDSGCTLPGDKFPNLDYLPFARYATCQEGELQVFYIPEVD